MILLLSVPTAVLHLWNRSSNWVPKVFVLRALHSMMTTTLAQRWRVWFLEHRVYTNDIKSGISLMF